MPEIHSLALCLSARELADFLPEPLLGECRQLARTSHVIDTQGLDAGGFAERVLTLAPDVVVAGWSTPVLPDVLPAELRYVCYLAGSIKRMVRREHVSRGLLVSNWGRSISRTVAEGALLLTLAALRRAGYWVPAMHRDGAWKNGVTETASLFGRRVGLHGFGNVARELIRLLRPFDVAIAVWVPETDPALYAAHGATRAASLEDLFAGSDVVVELAPLLPETQGIVTEQLLRAIRPGGAFINVARGALVDEEALVRVAKDGHIQIALDVYNTEPLPRSSTLRGLPNVTLFPHLAGPTPDRRRDAGALGVRNLRAYVRGEPLESVIGLREFDAVA